MEGVVVVRTLLFDLRGETPEAPSAGSLLTCGDEVREGACDTPVSVVEGVEGDEAEVCDAGMYEGVDVGRPGRGEPRDERCDLVGHPIGRGRLEVHDGVFAPGARHDAHGFVPAAECVDGHALRPRKPCREQRRLPAAEPRESDGRLGVARGVEEDRDEAVHCACRGGCARTIEPKLARHRCSHGNAVETLPLDQRRREGFFLDGRRLEARAVGQADKRGLCREPPQRQARGSERDRDGVGLPRQAVGPGGVFPEVRATEGGWGTGHGARVA